MNIKAYYLIQEKEEVDEYGEIIRTGIERKVYPSISSTRQSEFYQAKAVGTQLEKTVTIREFEFKGERKIREDNTVYEIERTSCPGNGNIELILKRGVNNVSA